MENQESLKMILLSYQYRIKMGNLLQASSYSFKKKLLLVIKREVTRMHLKLLISSMNTSLLLRMKSFHSCLYSSSSSLINLNQSKRVR